MLDPDPEGAQKRTECFLFNLTEPMKNNSVTIKSQKKIEIVIWGPT